MKNKKGFTLIELLVVIALMLSILGISIISLVNVSKNKKKEAFKNVKSQIETAAVEYFNANEYLFEGLSGNAAEGTISVGKLVEEGYLNKVTNPVTNESISPCALVIVKKEGNKYDMKFEESTIDSNSNECDKNDYIKFSVVSTNSCSNSKDKVSQEYGECISGKRS